MTILGPSDSHLNAPSHGAKGTTIGRPAVFSVDFSEYVPYN